MSPEPPKRCDRTREDLTRQFLHTVCGDARSPADFLARALRARGFLVEVRDETVHMTDNAHRDDLAFLRTLSDHFRLGLEIAGTNIRWVRASRGNLHRIFMGPRIGGEAGYMRWWASWRQFRRFRHGLKAPVSALEDFMAYLVKAVSAAGMSTYSSCDGHGGIEARLDFIGRYSCLWFGQLLTVLGAGQGREGTKWRLVSHEHVAIASPNVLGLWLDIHRVADTIYRERVRLRQLKQAAVNNLRQSPALDATMDDMPAEGISDIFGRLIMALPEQQEDAAAE